MKVYKAPVLCSVHACHMCEHLYNPSVSQRSAGHVHALRFEGQTLVRAACMYNTVKRLQCWALKLKMQLDAIFGGMYPSIKTCPCSLHAWSMLCMQHPLKSQH